MADPAEADKEYRAEKVLCSIDGCAKPKHGHGMCAAHLSKFRKYGDPLRVSERLSLRTAWLLAQVETRDRTHCWDWPFWKDRKGYGEINVNNKHWRAHAMALVLDGSPRPDPPNHHALHSCDNPGCVNPNHVRWGTHQENVADAVSRDRNTKGERVPQHRLTEDQVRSIRKDSRTLKAIAEEYGVCFQTIGLLKQGITWRHVK
jgi:hypothetical protein